MLKGDDGAVNISQLVWYIVTMLSSLPRLQLGKYSVAWVVSFKAKMVGFEFVIKIEKH